MQSVLWHLRGVRSLIGLLGLLAGCGAPVMEAADAGAARDVSVAREVRVRLPSSWDRDALAGVRVTLRQGAQTLAAETDGEGLARFPTATGAWQVEATREVTAEEARALTGHARAVSLRAAGTLTEGALSLTLQGPALGGLIIRELYYSGSPGVNGNHYFSDQFIALYNNGTETVFADGLCVADAHGPAGRINPGTAPTTFGADTAGVVVESVWQIPGTGEEFPVRPGESLVIAHDGANHQPFSTLDLSDADWEAFNARSDMRDDDSPTVPNLRRVVFNGGLDWLLPVFGGSVIVFRVDDVDALERVRVPGFTAQRARVPVSAVIDAVDALMDGDSVRYKRIPAALDRGFTHVSGTYTGESVRRVRAAMVRGRTIYQDTDDSAADFTAVETPTPRPDAP